MPSRAALPAVKPDLCVFSGGICAAPVLYTAAGRYTGRGLRGFLLLTIIEEVESVPDCSEPEEEAEAEAEPESE